MKKLTLIPILALLITGNITAQERPGIPNLMINPDFLPKTTRVLDSVVQYTESSTGDSSFLRKWKYFHFEEGNICESVMYYWNLALREWSAPRSKYVYGLDTQDRLYLQEHYTYMYSNGTWKGCDSEGCGKKEWEYDANGKLILRTQYYWNTVARNWQMAEKWEYRWDAAGNMVLEAWGDSKNEYSYDTNGNQIGHVSYYWAGGDPYDWYPEYKVERSFDNFGNMTMYTSFIWRKGEWIGGYYHRYYDVKWAKADLKHDSNGQKISVQLYIWDNELNGWIPDLKEDSKYDGQGRPISEMVIQFSYGDGHEFIPQRKEYGYDKTGLKKSETTTSWSNRYGVWNWGNPIKEEYTYDSGKKIVLAVQFRWNSDLLSWQKSNKTGYSYDQAGNLVEQVVYQWDPEFKDWRPSSRQVWSFDELGNQVLSAYYSWSRESENWTGSQKDEKAFDSKGNMTMEAYYMWNYVSGSWMGRSMGWNQVENWPEPGKIEYGYDDSGRLVLYAAYMWDGNLNDWIGYNIQGSKKEWGYETSGKLIQEISYEWAADIRQWKEASKTELSYNENNDPSIQDQYAWNPDIPDWKLILRSIFYYRSSVTGTKEIPTDNISLWPNPTTGLITISGLTQPVEVRVYSVHGQLHKRAYQVDNQIDISDLPAGLYYIRIKSGRMEQSGRVVLMTNDR